MNKRVGAWEERARTQWTQVAKDRRPACQRRALRRLAPRCQGWQRTGSRSSRRVWIDGRAKDGSAVWKLRAAMVGCSEHARWWGEGPGGPSFRRCPRVGPCRRGGILFQAFDGETAFRSSRGRCYSACSPRGAADPHRPLCISIQISLTVLGGSD